MKNWTTVGMLAIAIVGTAVISINLVSYAPEILIAYGGVSLDPDDVAHSMVVRINEFGDRHEHSFDSCSPKPYNNRSF